MLALLAQAQGVTGQCQNCMNWGGRGAKVMNGGWVNGPGSVVLMVILGIFWVLFVFSFIAVLVALARWLWKKGDEEEKKTKKS